MCLFSFTISCFRLHSFGCFTISAACFSSFCCGAIGVFLFVSFTCLGFFAMGNFVGTKHLRDKWARWSNVARPSLVLWGEHGSEALAALQLRACMCTCKGMINRNSHSARLQKEMEITISLINWAFTLARTVFQKYWAWARKCGELLKPKDKLIRTIPGL